VEIREKSFEQKEGKYKKRKKHKIRKGKEIQENRIPAGKRTFAATGGGEGGSGGKGGSISRRT